MDLTTITVDEQALCDAVAAAAVVVPVGSGTHREVGGPVPHGTEVRAPTGVVAYDPAELTVTVRAGTTMAELDGVLGAADQECPLDPREPEATVGGTLAAGLSGHRRVRYGPLRERVLEVQFVTADGRVVRGGGPTVKNVTGYDVPRLLVGSLGTIGVLTRVILRCQPRPATRGWFTTEQDPAEVRRRCFRPSTLRWTGDMTTVLLEGHPDDVAAEARAAALEPVPEAPPLPGGPHRGRVSVAADRIMALCDELSGAEEIRWSAEWGVGTVHIGCSTQDALAHARAAAERVGGWLLREAGAPGLDGFGVALPNGVLMARVKAAFDPTGKLSPGRLPITAA